MSKKSSIGGRRRAWDMLRVALLWARKGGVLSLRNRLVIRLNVVQKGIIEKLGRHSPRGGRALAYGDRELSFDDTPVIRVKMSRRPYNSSSVRFRMPRIPCIKPRDFDYDFEFDDIHDNDDDDVNDHGYDNVEEVNEGCDDEEIDMKAEAFIDKFYEQLKLQRQISYLQYN